MIKHEMTMTLSYCGEMSRTQDPDRFLLSMFAPAPAREAIWALLAFNHEIAKTREVVSETQLGLIRLQWWREAIGKIYEGQVLEHEVIRPLAAAIRTHALPLELFETLIYAREFDLEDTLPGNIEGFLNYCDFTSTPLFTLISHVMQGPHIESEPVRPVAVNYALAGLLRAVSHFARQRRCLLPEDLLMEHGQGLNTLYEFKPAEGLPRVIKGLADHAVQGVKTENRFLKGANGLAWMVLGQLKGLKYDVFDPRFQRPPPLKALRLLLSIM